LPKVRISGKSESFAVKGMPRDEKPERGEKQGVMNVKTGLCKEREKNKKNAYMQK